jgi:YfiH family protein
MNGADFTEGVLARAEPAPGFSVSGTRAWTTTRANGSFGLGSDEPVGQVMHRWGALQADLLAAGASRLASATQVHGDAVTIHGGEWSGWLRGSGVDGHATTVRGTALAVTIADCTPVFIAHERGIALLHAGWRGTASRILEAGLVALSALAIPADECVVHLGPSICRDCYEVGPEVMSAVTGRPAAGKAKLDVRLVLAEQAMALGVRRVAASAWCTRCNGDRFFSHRGGDAGRQLGVLAFV